KPYDPLFHSERFGRASDDGFFLHIAAADANYDAAATSALLRDLGALHVEDVDRQGVFDVTDAVDLHRIEPVPAAADPVPAPAAPPPLNGPPRSAPSRDSSRLHAILPRPHRPARPRRLSRDAVRRAPDPPQPQHGLRPVLQAAVGEPALR